MRRARFRAIAINIGRLDRSAVQSKFRRYTLKFLIHADVIDFKAGRELRLRRVAPFRAADREIQNHILRGINGLVPCESKLTVCF